MVSLAPIESPSMSKGGLLEIPEPNVSTRSPIYDSKETAMPDVAAPWAKSEPHQHFRSPFSAKH